MLHRPIPALAAVLALATLLADAAPAQRTIVNPPANASKEGNSRIIFPFGFTRAMRFQQICGLSAIPSAAGSISQVAFRRDNDVIVRSGNYGAWTANFTLSLSTSPRTTFTMSKEFAKNVGSDVKVVHSGTLNWPAQAKMPPGPTKFAYTVPIKTPFVYASARGDILLDLTQTTNSNPNKLFFMDADSSSAGSSSKTLGPGCPKTVGGRNANQVVVWSNWGPGATARILQWNAPDAVPSILGFGSTANTWMGLKLPLNLGFIQAPACNVYHDNIGLLFGKTTKGFRTHTGRWDVSLPIPNDPSLGGKKIRTQFYNLQDKSAGNPANLSTSSGHEITMATPKKGVPPQSEAHAGPTIGKTAALLQQGYGMVVEFTFR